MLAECSHARACFIPKDGLECAKNLCVIVPSLMQTGHNPTLFVPDKNGAIRHPWKTSHAIITNPALFICLCVICRYLMLCAIPRYILGRIGSVLGGFRENLGSSKSVLRRSGRVLGPWLPPGFITSETCAQTNIQSVLRFICIAEGLELWFWVFRRGETLVFNKSLNRK